MRKARALSALHSLLLRCSHAPSVSSQTPPAQSVPSLPGTRQSQVNRSVLPSAALRRDKPSAGAPCAACAAPQPATHLRGFATKPCGWSCGCARPRQHASKRSWRTHPRALRHERRSSASRPAAMPAILPQRRRHRRRPGTPRAGVAHAAAHAARDARAGDVTRVGCVQRSDAGGLRDCADALLSLRKAVSGES